MLNFRDVADRSAGVRPEVLWRSDAPVSPAPPHRRPDPDVVPGLTWPPRTVIDLREPDEGSGPHPMAAPGTEIVHLPLTGTLAPAEQARLTRGETDLAGLYRMLLSGAGAWLPTLVRTVAHAEGPILLHCAAGKDRTGVTVAALLAVADVPREEIVADYTATRAALPELVPRLGLERYGDRATIEHLLDVSVPAISAVLDDLGPDPAAFHRDHGVATDDIAAWRTRIRSDACRADGRTARGG